MCVASHFSHNALYTVYLHLIARFQICAIEKIRKSVLDPPSNLADVERTAPGPETLNAIFIPRDNTRLQDYTDDVVGAAR
jgi:3-hydroxyphenylacetate 6-hydroxylase